MCDLPKIVDIVFHVNERKLYRTKLRKIQLLFKLKYFLIKPWIKITYSNTVTRNVQKMFDRAFFNVIRIGDAGVIIKCETVSNRTNWRRRSDFSGYRDFQRQSHPYDRNSIVLQRKETPCVEFHGKFCVWIVFDSPIVLSMIRRFRRVI